MAEVDQRLTLTQLGVIAPLAVREGAPVPSSVVKAFTAALGKDSHGLLMLRRVRTGANWHRDWNAASGREPPIVPSVDFSLTTASTAERQDCAPGGLATLHAWWRGVSGRSARRRVGQQAVRFHGLVCLGEKPLLLRNRAKGGDSNTEIVDLAGKTLQERLSLMESGKYTYSAPPSVHPGYHATDADFGTQPGHGAVVAAWTAWWDEQNGRLAIELEADGCGLCVGTLLLSISPELVTQGSRRRVLLHTLADAWAISRMCVRHYFTLWNSVYGLRIIQAINRHAPLTDTADIKAVDHTDLFSEASERIRPLLLAVGEAFQSPAVALFAPDTSGRHVGLFSHIGYTTEQPAVWDDSFQGGITGHFCTSLRPIAEQQRPGVGQDVDMCAFQLRDGSDVQRCYEILKQEKPASPPFDSYKKESDPTYPSDRLLAATLASTGDRDRPRGAWSALFGPWAYAEFRLDDTWQLATHEPFKARTIRELGLHSNDKEGQPGGTIKFIGRVRCELDPPHPQPFSSRELRRMHVWAALVALVFQRVVQRIDRQLVQTMVDQCATRVKSWGLAGFADAVRTSLAAEGVAILEARPGSQPGRGGLVWLARAWGDKLSNDDAGLDAWLSEGGTTGPAVRALLDGRRISDTFAPAGAAALTCHAVPVRPQGGAPVVMVVCGIPPEFKPSNGTSPPPSPPGTPPPPLISRRLDELERVLQLYLGRAELRCAMGSDLRARWDELVAACPDDDASPTDARRALVEDFLVALRSRWRTQEDLANELGLDARTVRTQLRRIAGRPASWRWAGTLLGTRPPEDIPPLARTMRDLL